MIVGVSSNEENNATSPTYPCCTFRGSVVALNARTGSILWKTYTVPPNSGPCEHPNPASGCGYSGGAVWDTPAIDPEATRCTSGRGNNYTAPDEARQCQKEAVEHETSDADCTAPNDYFDSVIALNLKTGAIKWGHKVEGWDAWNVACQKSPGVTWCPSIESPDSRLRRRGTEPPEGERPHARRSRAEEPALNWAFNPTNGEIVWDTLVGPGTGEGGIEWGTAYAGEGSIVPDLETRTLSVPSNTNSRTGNTTPAARGPR